MQTGRAERRALRYFIYIKLLGNEPLSFEHADYAAYELALQAQFALLCLKAGVEGARSARKHGDELIRKRGIFATAAELSSLSGPMILASTTDSAKNSPYRVTRSPTGTERHNCRRKIRHTSLWNALLHALELRDPNVCVYTCTVCGALHVGHDQTGRRPRPERAVRNRLNLIDQALRELDRGIIELRREKKVLSKKIRHLTFIPKISKIAIQLFCWVRPSRRSVDAV
jgi:hypothetical protein